MGEWGGKFAGTREGTDCIAVGTERAGPSKASHDWVKLLLSLSLRAWAMEYDGIDGMK